MNVIDKALSCDKEPYRSIGWDPVSVDRFIEQAPRCMDLVEHYTLMVKVQCNFSCQPNEFSQAHRQARDFLTGRVYGHLNPLLSQLEKAVYGRDAETCFEVIQKMRDYIK